MGSHPLTTFLLLALVYLCAADPLVAVDCSDYNGFLASCNRSRSDNETVYQQRRAAFKANCQTVNSNNSKFVKNELSFSSVLYCTSADVPEELRAAELGLNPVKFEGVRVTSVPSGDSKVAASTPPTSLNYVTSGKVTSVKNQGSCGCCWSFASIAMYESKLLIQGFPSYGLSEQASLECTSNYAPGKRVSDCSGGYFVDPLTYLAKVGSVLRSNYPYISGAYGSGAGYPYTPGICNETQRIMLGNGTATTYGPLTRTQVKTLLVSYGPVMVGVYANNGFTNYGGGVYSGCPADAANSINHAVLLVGYDDATSSWLIKNQWSNSWGEAGYMRLSYSNDCGLTSLLGNVVFSAYNADPSVTLSSSQLFTNIAKWEQGVSAALTVLLLIALLAL